MGSAPLFPTQAERARERDVFPFYPLSLDIPDLSSIFDASPHCPPSPSHCPRPSNDPVLTAIAQLAAVRLGAQRALVSLIDSRSQIVLAEATPTLPLCPESTIKDESTHDALWLGCATFPRDCGLCELVLDAAGSAIVINDLQHDSRFASRSFSKLAPSSLRFYASAPLVAHTGSIVGAVSVFNDEPRNGLAPHLVRALHDVAAAAMAYFNASCALSDNQRAERLVRGLTSFVTGASDLQRHADLEVPRSPPNPIVVSPLPHPSDVPVLERPVASRTTSASAVDPGPSGDMDELLVLQDIILPPGAKRMFSRAANIMRDSGGFSGVIIFDASLANPGNLAANTPPSTPPLDSHDAGASSTLCKILGFADVEASSRTGTSPKSDYLSLAASDLKRLLNQNPQGKIFNFPLSPTGTESSSGDDTPYRERPRWRGRRRKFSPMAAIMDVAQDARSAAVVPLWDFQRQRWFAGCLCWTTDPRRLLSHGSDLLYLRTFGNSIMIELSRLDALSVDRVKSTFIESMSHELRSPLHGILGGIEYLRGTELDSAQSTIVASIGLCGRTLLDTVGNVLEYSKINEKSGTPPPKRHHPTCNSSTPTADIRQLTEETVEAVFAGHSYSVSSIQGEEADEAFMHMSSHDMPLSPTGAPVRRAIRIILDMAENRPWHFALQPGIWRRIVMNIFGNALKFTDTGFIRVSLSATDIDESEATVSLTVADSGAGMSPHFLHDGLFKAFSQENPFVTGTGLGLSIVRRLVDSLGGSVNVQSQQDVGTEIRITATFRKRACRGENLISTMAAKLQGKRICIPDGFTSTHYSAPPSVVRGERYFVESLAQSLGEWFGARVGSDVDPDDDQQLVVYPGPNIKCASKSRPYKAMSVIVALDALEAATLRTDARIAGGRIEVVTQPCGPYKLARILERYLNRQASAAATPPRATTAALPLHPTAHPARPPPPAASSSSSPRPWPLSRLPTFRPTPPLPPPTTSSNLLPPSSPRRASIPHLSTSHSTNSIPLHRHRRPQHPSSAHSTPTTTPKPRSVSASPSHRHLEPEILIVDDNPINVRLLSVFLSKHGFPHHQSAPNGLEAVRLFKAQPRRWAAILMDLSMPVMDGATATREIRAWERRLSGRGVEVIKEGQREQPEESEREEGHEEELEKGPPGVQIIVTTGLGSATARFEALSAGADEYMTKPIQFGPLMRMLNRRVEDRAAAPPPLPTT